MKLLLPLLILLGNFEKGHSQKSIFVNSNSNLDTLDIYLVTLEMNMKSGYARYFVDSIEIDENKYNFYSRNNEAVFSSTTCWLKAYDINKHLLVEAVISNRPNYHLIGAYIEYYLNGQIKTKGHYKSNVAEKLAKLNSENPYSLKHGDWTYYEERGNITGFEIYLNGELVNFVN